MERKRIAVWGTDRRCAMWYWWLKEHYEIVCFVDGESSGIGRIDGIDLISKHELERYPYEAVVAVTDGPEDEIVNEALEMGTARRVYTLDDFAAREGLVGDYEKKEAERQSKIIKEILEAADGQVRNYEWMYRKIIEYGVFCFHREWYKVGSGIHWSFEGVQQVPEEFAEYCVWLSGLSVKTALELGVYRGRSAYFMCAVLARRNPELRYLMADMRDRLDYFEQFRKVLPMLEKRIPSTSADYRGKRFDYVFIDANHSYDASIADYENVGAFSNVVTAFHDIYGHEYDHENGGTVRTWKEVVERTKDRDHKVFSRYPDRWMGIGCVLNGKQ